MQIVNSYRATYSLPEKFFVEKTIELLHRGTIDTYRARIMNPRTIIDELTELVKERLRGRIPNAKAIHYAAEEAKLLLENAEQCGLNFSPFSHQTIIAHIGTLLGDLKPEGLKKILIVLKNFSINHNSYYALKLFDELNKSIKEYDDSKTVIDNEPVLERINTITNYLITELISIGYTKRHLYRKLSDIFNSSAATDFDTSLEKMKKLAGYEPTEYVVAFKLEIPDEVVKNLNPIPNVEIVMDLLELEQFVTEKSHDSVKAFKNNRGRSTYFYILRVRAYDSFQALNKARISFSENLDLIHLGYSKEYISPWPKVLVASKISNTNYYLATKPLEYDLDGNYRAGNSLYKIFIAGIGKIEANRDIKADSKEKIKSAIRYLRLGNEAIEVEHKFINYWVALEYLFSDTISDNEESTINKIKRVFPRVHSNIFIKRLIKDFHDNIVRLKLDKTIPGFSMDFMSYLSQQATYDWIADNLANDYPLLVYRAMKLKQIIFTPIPAVPDLSPIEKRVRRHKKDLELHLSRMYRIRNSIVHDAAVGKNIISITANLKYYLIFIISHIIKALESNHALRSIEDLFSLEESIYDSLEKERFPIEKVLGVDTHFEMID